MMHIPPAKGEFISLNAQSREDGEDATGGQGEGYHSFQGRQVKGVLYRLSPMTNQLRKRMTRYVHDGYMDKDLRYVQIIYGLMNTSGKKDFEMFWESPWVEEHVRDTSKKKKVDAQQRAMAVKSYIRANAQVLHCCIIVFFKYVFNKFFEKRNLTKPWIDIWKQ